jgi:hypothetical protein
MSRSDLPGVRPFMNTWKRMEYVAAISANPPAKMPNKRSEAALRTMAVTISRTSSSSNAPIRISAASTSPAASRLPAPAISVRRRTPSEVSMMRVVTWRG